MKTESVKNRTVYSNLETSYASVTPKIMRENPTVVNLSELNMQKVSTLYHSLTFLGNFFNNGELSVFKQQHVY